MKGRIVVALASIVLLAFGMLAAACDGDKEGGDEDPTSRWLELLGHVPDHEATRFLVVMNDHARAREAFGIALPEPDADQDALLDYTLQLLMDEEGGPTGLIREITVAGLTRTEVGFTIAEVDQDIQAGGPPSQFQVLHGRFDRQAIDQAVRSDPLWSDLLEEASHRGVDYYLWGEDYSQDLSRSSTARPNGGAYRLALHGDYLYWAPWTGGLEALIATAAGELPSLADLEEYQLLAQGLDSLDTFTALFTDQTDPFSVSNAAERAGGLNATAEGVEAIRERLQNEPQLLPYQAYATGAGVDANGTYTAVVVVHAEEAAARQNVQRLEDRIKQGTILWGTGEEERLSQLIDDFHVSSQGRLVIAKLYTQRGLYTDPARLWIQLFHQMVPLLLHE